LVSACNSGEMSLLLQLNSDVSPVIRSVFIYHKHNRLVLTNRVGQQVLLKRRKPFATLHINPNNRHGYNLCIPLFDLEISAVVLLCNVRFEAVPKTAVRYFISVCKHGATRFYRADFRGISYLDAGGWFVGWSVGRLVGWLVGRSVGMVVCWSVGWLVGRSIGRYGGLLVGWLVGWSVRRLVCRLVCWSVGWYVSWCRSVGQSVGWSVGMLVGRSVDRLVGWSVGRLVCWSAGRSAS
jgi:hypothetical protein